MLDGSAAKHTAERIAEQRLQRRGKWTGVRSKRRERGG
jgi:hypothetical protein